MLKKSLFLTVSAVLLMGCGSTPTAPKQTSTIKILTDTLADVQNDELVNLYVNLEGLTGVTKVEFYRDGQLLGEDTTAPYTWLDEFGTNPQYTYYAVAYAGSVKDYSNQLDVKPKLKAKLTTLGGKLNDVSAYAYPLTLKPWTGGAGQLTVKGGESGYGTGTLNADGTFSVTLTTPAASSLTPLTPMNLLAGTGLTNCTGDASVTAGSTSSAPTMLRAIAEVGTPTRTGRAAPLQILPPTPAIANGQQKEINYYYVGSLIYVPNAFIVGGSLTCPHADGTKTTVGYNLILTKGWNKVIQQYTVNPSSPTLGKINFAVPTGGRFPAADGAESWVMLPSMGYPLTQN